VRYGVIADVHANLAAFRTALAKLEKIGVDEIVCAGDLVGYGPHPNEVVDAVADRNMPCVLGNHDEVIATGTGFDRVGELAARTLRWTEEHISSSARAFLASLPVNRMVEGGVTLAHGALNDPWEYVRRTEDAYSQLAGLDQAVLPGSESKDGRGDPVDSAILVFGHTHRQLVVVEGSGAAATAEWILARRRRRAALGTKTAINPGSVGQPREPRNRCRFALLDLEARSVDLYAVPYPDAETVAALRRERLPEAACHVKPTFKKVLRQAVRDYEDRKKR
jgi:predicted phosphodiesterase